MNELEYWLRDLILTDQPVKRRYSKVDIITEDVKKSTPLATRHYRSQQPGKTHEERAIELIDNLPGIPVPFRRLPGPFKAYEPAKQIAKWLIRKDPLGLID